MKKKRLFVLSADALVVEDLAFLRKCPNLGPFLAHCCGTESIRTIYPSLTYPVHVSIQTGCYPETHHVITNSPQDAAIPHIEWTWDARLIHKETIFEAAKKAGYSTAAVFWPVTANNPYIDYHVPEYWLARENETLRGAFGDMGASDEMLNLMEENAYLLNERYAEGEAYFTMEPELSDFCTSVSCDIIRSRKPEVMFLHLSCIDTTRHRNGIFGPEVNKALLCLDRWFGMLRDAMKQAGVWKDTNFVLLSDHGQMDVARVVKPNVLLAENGFLTMNDDGRIRDYKALGLSNGMSMVFWLKDPNDRETHDRLYQLLNRYAEEGVYGFRQVWTREQAHEKEGLDGPFAFCVETDGYTSFGDGYTRPYVSDFDFRDYRMGHATHGYLPDKGPQPVFLAAGPDFREDVMIGRRSIVDEAPTFAKLLGVPMPDAQGVPLDELLR